MSDRVVKLSAESFGREVLESSQPVLVDFSATWCGPCKVLGPIFDQLASESDGVKFAKLDIDDAYEIASKYKISAVPMVALFKEGKLVDSLIGLRRKEELRQLITA